MTTDERNAQYIAAYRDVLDAVYDSTKYISPMLRRQVDALEASMDAATIERLREIARH